MDATIALLLVATALMTPFLLAMTRQLTLAATAVIVGAPLLLPVVGWFIALGVALTLPRRQA